MPLEADIRPAGASSPLIVNCSCQCQWHMPAVALALQLAVGSARRSGIICAASSFISCRAMHLRAAQPLVRPAAALRNGRLTRSPWKSAGAAAGSALVDLPRRGLQLPVAVLPPVPVPGSGARGSAGAAHAATKACGTGAPRIKAYRLRATGHGAATHVHTLPEERGHAIRMDLPRSSGATRAPAAP